MNAIQIQGVTIDELMAGIADTVKQMAAPIAQGEPLSEVADFKVDRGFLMKNFNWTMYKIRQLEMSGEIKHVFACDAKARYYRLGDCLEVLRKERSPNRGYKPKGVLY